MCVFPVFSSVVPIAVPCRRQWFACKLLQMKMEDMSLSGLDNTKLEVSSGLHFYHPIMFGGSCPALKQEVAHVVSFPLWICFVFCCPHRPWLRTSTRTWWRTPVWACVSRCTVLSNRATSSWMTRTKKAWRTSVRTRVLSPGSGYLVHLSAFNLLVSFMHVLALLRRNCWPTRSGHFRASVQSVEEQGVCVSQLQPEHCCVPLCPSSGEMPGHGAQQQPHRQPQVSKGHWTWTVGTTLQCDIENKPIHSSSEWAILIIFLILVYRIASSNNMNNKSESDQEDNDDVNDNDWSYGSEKKGVNPCLNFFVWL